jgi:tripartite-type tricarboxylate transporter receptor subunit TctC
MTLDLRRRRLGLLGLALCAPAWPAAAAADSVYPSRTITLVVPYPPGGTNDNVARIVARRLQDLTKQTVVINNKGGAGGLIGTGEVAAAPADGYTLLSASIGNLAIAPQLMKADFDPFADLVPVAFCGAGRATVAVNPAVPVKTLAELIAYAKAHPGKLSFGTSGVGTPGHLAGETLKQLTGIDIRHVPYRGSAAAVADAVAGQVDIIFDPLSTPFIKAGSLRALAYFGGPTPPADLPDLPSMAQAGVNGWQDALAGSFFIVARRSTPPEVLAQLRQRLDQVLREPDTVRALAKVQVVVEPLTLEQTERQIHAVHDLAQRLIAAGRISAE